MGMKKLFIDYEICNRCSECVAKCSYIMHPENNGITSLRELISFMLVCRKCEENPCIKVCPNDALKRVEGINKRATFLCISCKSCSIACPFGTIIPEVIPFFVSKCDFCIGRLKEGENPLCVETCPHGAVKFVDEEEIKEEEDIHKIGDNLIVKAFNWLETYGFKK
ncbi:MAG: 4Fe-4S ferredoxin [Candidatus Omnitrophota bacterium]|nr:MAG: 4Fe-4S ferredoxin [Candidatus Omnitrophota bacterium]